MTVHLAISDFFLLDLHFWKPSILRFGLSSRQCRHRIFLDSIFKFGCYHQPTNCKRSLACWSLVLILFWVWKSNFIHKHDILFKMLFGIWSVYRHICLKHIRFALKAFEIRQIEVFNGELLNKKFQWETFTKKSLLRASLRELLLQTTTIKSSESELFKKKSKIESDHCVTLNSPWATIEKE